MNPDELVSFGIADGNGRDDLLSPQFVREVLGYTELREHIAFGGFLGHILLSR